MLSIFKEKRAYPTSKEIENRFGLLRLLLAIAIALSVAMVIIILISDDPLNAIYSFVIGPLTTKRRIGNIIEMMTPLLFTGVGVCLIFSADQVNMAVEGGFLVGALGATIVATSLELPAGIHQVAALAMGGLFGLAACAIPAFFFVKFKAKPVVSSIMTNWICLYAALGVINHVLRDPEAGYLCSYKFAESARLPKLLDGTSIHFGIFIGIAVVIIGYLFLYKSKSVFAFRMVGKNMDLASYSGIPVNKVLILAQLAGGFLAGMRGAVEVLGMYKRFHYHNQTGHGCDGILVGIIAGFNPKLVPLAVLFLAYVRVGADVMQRSSDIPIELVNIIQAIIIMLVVAERFLEGQKHKRLVKAAQMELAVKEDAENE